MFAFLLTLCAFSIEAFVAHVLHPTSYALMGDGGWSATSVLHFSWWTLCSFTWRVYLRNTRLQCFCVSGVCLSAQVITQRPHANYSSVGPPSFMRIDADGDAPRFHLIELKGKKKIPHLNANGACPLELSHFFSQIDPGGLTSLRLMETELLMPAVIWSVGGETTSPSPHNVAVSTRSFAAPPTIRISTPAL